MFTLDRLDVTEGENPVMVCVVFSSLTCYDFVFCDSRVCFNRSMCGAGEVATSVSGGCWLLETMRVFTPTS